MAVSLRLKSAPLPSVRYELWPAHVLRWVTDIVYLACEFVAFILITQVSFLVENSVPLSRYVSHRAYLSA